MKKLLLSARSLNPAIRFDLRMKLTTLLLFVTFCTLHANSTYSQRNRASIKLKNGTIERFIDKMEKNTDFRFVYRILDVDLSREVSITAENEPIRQILEKVFENTDITFSILGNQIYLKSVRSEKSKEPSNTTGAIQFSVSGTVIDNEGNPLPGASIIEKGTTNGASTDFDGNYTISVGDENAILMVSYIGFATKEVAVGGRSEVQVTLMEDTAGLEEVVVVGYGTQKAEEVTSAISSVKAEDFVQGTVTDAAQLIQGKVAGLNIITPDANPTGTSQINLRGVITLLSSSQPLILVDGVPGTLDEVSPQEVESIDVLKGGSAAAIYGTRGSNGVILITTKSVKEEIPPTISLNSSSNIQIISRKLDFLNANEYRAKVREGLSGAIDQGSTTDWLDEVTQVPISQIHDISIKGGKRTSNYNVSLRYSELNGIMKKSYNKKIYPRFEINHSMFDGVLDISANINSSVQESFAGTPNGDYNQGIYYNALIYNPTAPVKNDDGGWFQNIDRYAYDNPVALLEETIGENQENRIKFYGTATLRPIENMSVRLLGSKNIYQSTLGYYETKLHTSTLRNGRNGYASRSTRKTQEGLFEATADYDKTFLENHQVTTLIGYSRNDYNFQSYGMQNWDFPTDDYDYNNIGAGLALTRGEANESSYQSENKLISYFLRMNYNFKSKYLLAASLRREGSSKFGENNKWANFPAISIGWNMHRESFLDSSPFLQRLKLRAGFGVTGTIPDDPYLSLSTLNFNTLSLIDGSWVQAIGPTSNPNPNLRWETKEEINIGLDFGLFDYRISGSVDIYRRTTKDMIWRYSVPAPPFLFDNITANAATMENKGIEINLNTVPVKTSDFEWNSTLNFSSNQNRVTSLSNDDFQLESGFFDVGSTGEPILQPTHRVQIGEPIGNFYGFESVGIDESGHWLIKGEDGGAKPISEQRAEDKYILGNALPDAYLNWNNTFTYKNFDLNVLMRGAFGFQILNMPRMFYEAPITLTRGNVLSSAFDNVNGEIPLAPDQELQYVSDYIEDGDYWKISNITLGYNMNVEQLKYFKKLRLYASAINAATITGYSGIDPEVDSAGLDQGIDNRYRYPAARTYTIGIALTF